MNLFDSKKKLGIAGVVMGLVAASGTALNAETGEIVAGAVPPAGKIAAIICIIICFVIAFTNKRSEAK